MMQTAEKPITLNLKLDGMVHVGEALAEIDGMPVHVFGGISGEEVLAQVVRRHRNYIAAQVVEVTAASAKRVEAPCPHFGQCTGCQWQHIGYEHQLHLKHTAVEEALEKAGYIRNAPMALPVPAPEPLGYRNHARFTVGPEGTLGFVNRESRQFVRIDRCLLMQPWINQALSELQGHCGQTTQASIRYGVNTGQWIIQPNLGTSVPLKSGQKYYEEVLLGRRFRINSASFFQVNTAQAERMAHLVIERLSLTGRELVIDAYAGVGTFAALLAPHADRVYAVEDSATAVQDARVNIQGLQNVEIITARTEDIIGSLPDATDALVLDPPRVGCHPLALHALLRRPPRRVVYLSCDPLALARDLRILLHGPFTLEEVLPIDLFPQTHHVECIATLSLDSRRHWAFQARQQLILASESPRRQEIMADMGLDFRVIAPKVEEPPPTDTDPVEVAKERALHKARAVASTLKEGTVIGGDTVVVSGNEILGKPASEEEARTFLHKLRGREHKVITGLAFIDAASGDEVTSHRRSRVHMRIYTDEEIDAYVASGDPMDKAGAYAIQDAQFHPVDRVRGCYLNVVGLPPCTLLDLMHQLGLYPPIDRRWTPPGNCPDCHRLAGKTRGK